MFTRSLLLCLASSTAYAIVFDELIAENLDLYALTVLSGVEVRMVPGGLSDASLFTVEKPGLTGEEGTVSFSWRGRASTYLKSMGADEKISTARGGASSDDTFKKEATFRLREKLATTVQGRSGVSIESVATPGHFIRHQGYVLRLSAISSTSALTDRLDASFWGRPFWADNPKNAPPSPPSVIYNERGLAWSTGSGGAATVETLAAGGSAGTALVMHSPDGLSGRTVTFEIANQPPGELLRRSEAAPSELVSSRFGGNLYDDAIFTKVPALSGDVDGGWWSYEHASSPGHYIVHSEGRLRVMPIATAVVDAGREIAVGSTTVRVGSTVALHNKQLNRFVRIDGRGDAAQQDHPRMDASTKADVSALPSDWSWELFTVVDAGNGEIALHNTANHRFVRMDGREDANEHPRMDTSGTVSANDLPANWAWERFTLVDAGNGEIALHSKQFNRFVRMDGREDASDYPRMDASAKADVNALPAEWSWERFTVVEVSPPPSSEALRKAASWKVASADTKHLICELPDVTCDPKPTSGRRSLTAALKEWAARESAAADRFERH